MFITLLPPGTEQVRLPAWRRREVFWPRPRAAACERWPGTVWCRAAWRRGKPPPPARPPSPGRGRSPGSNLSSRWWRDSTGWSVLPASTREEATVSGLRSGWTACTKLSHPPGRSSEVSWANRSSSCCTVARPTHPLPAQSDTSAGTIGPC